ncbi:MAG: hypothetical protein JRM80_10480 [Nitrososphaerota archaeon]|nr:hypothetical protein [Nitrososphaerota archaeon]
MGIVGPKSIVYQISSGYLRISRYFFLALAVAGLLGTVTGVFAQGQQQQLTLTLSDVKVVETSLHLVDVVSVSGTVTVSGPAQGSWSGGPLHFGGWAYVTGEDRFGNDEEVNITLSSGDFNPSTLSFPASSDSSFSNQQNGPHTIIPYAIVVHAYDQSGELVGISNVLQGAGQAGSSANLFILTMEIPLFQVPALGISASNPDFSNLFATFDQLPLGDFYMLLAEVAIILLVGAGLINVIMYLTGNGTQKGGTSGTLAGLSNVLMTLLLVFLLPFAYNAVAGFVNVLDQQIIAGPPPLRPSSPSRCSLLARLPLSSS